MGEEGNKGFPFLFFLGGEFLLLFFTAPLPPAVCEPVSEIPNFANYGTLQMIPKGNNPPQTMPAKH